MILIYRALAELLKIIFWVATQLLVLIVNVANAKVFENDVVNAFTNRVYVILGILMLFKLVISAIQYLINPDSFDDKSKGFSNLIKKVAISISLIVLVPFIFEFAMSIQGIILRQLPTVVFGVGSDIELKNGKQDTLGQKITYDEDNNPNFSSVADDISYHIIDGFLMKKKEVVDMEKNRITVDVKTTANTLRNQEGKTIWDINEVVLSGCGGFLDDFMGDHCHYDLYWLLCIPVGIYLVFMYLSMTIDVGIRAIKLGLLRIFSPIPIANYITDEKKTTEWATTTLKVYADLFIRMFIIYFVVEIIWLFLGW